MPAESPSTHHRDELDRLTEGDEGSFRRPLRVGVLLDSFEQPRWVGRILSEIVASGVAEVALVVKREAQRQEVITTGSARSRASRWRNIYQNRRKLLYVLYERLDNRRFREEPDPFGRADVSALMPNAPVLAVVPRTTKHCDYLEDADVESIRRYDLDVALRFGFRILKGRALGIARHGLWSYHHGDNNTYRGGPAGFWEVMEGNPVTGSILQILTEALDAGHVLYRSYSGTDLFSVWKNKRNYYWKSAAFVMRKLRELHADGAAALEECTSRTAPGWSAYSNRLYTAPDNGDMARLLWRLARRFIQSKLRGSTQIEQWFLAYRVVAGIDQANEVPDGTMHRFHSLVPPKDRLWADPCPVACDGRYFIFFEEQIHARRKAHICVVEVNEKGVLSEPTVALERDYHLSYPFVFAWNGQHYMIPESAERRTVELFRAVSFPHQWELDRILLSDVRASDATVAEINGGWWMFVNIAVDGASPWDELHLYLADGPLGPWRPHRRNPIKSDVRNARPAGRIFQWEKRYYRPSQDCSVSYGHAIVINRIEVIDSERYREVEVSRIAPSWLPRLTGTHTISAAGGLTVVDARMWRWRWSRGR